MQNIATPIKQPTFVLTPKLHTPDRRHSTHSYFTFPINSCPDNPPIISNKNDVGIKNLRLNISSIVNKSAISARHQYQTDRSFDNNNQRYTTRMYSPKVRKIVGKNILKPSNKPISVQRLQNNLSFRNQSPGKQQRIDQPNNFFVYQVKDLPQTLQIINQTLKQQKLYQSIDPIVQPYRDKSTDSYHYGHGYGFKDIINQNVFKQNFNQRPTASEEYTSHDLQQLVQPTKPDFINLPASKINKYTHPYSYNNIVYHDHPQPYNKILYHDRIHRPLIQVHSPIKQVCQQQKSYKQLYQQNQQKNQDMVQNNKYTNYEEIYDSKNVQINTIKQLKNQSYDSDSDYANHNQQIHERFKKRDNKYNYYQHYENQAEKCTKITHLYQPFSMHLTSNSNNKNQNVADQQSNTSKNTNVLHLYLSKIDKLRNNKILQNTSKQAQFFQEQDKWDKILRERQKTYKSSFSRQNSQYQMEDRAAKVQQITVANTAIKHQTGNHLQQLHHYSAASYQSSDINRQNGQSSQIQYSELALSGPHIHGPSFYPASANYTYLHEKNSQTYNNNNFYNNINLIADKYTEKPTQAQTGYTKQLCLLNQMKYSYNFEQNKQIDYLVQKQLFSKLLQSNKMQWILILNKMIEYVQNRYLNKWSNRQNNNNQVLVTFAKIGTDSESIYENRIIAHYIGIWLLSMGYGDSQTKQRIIQNVDLMFIDIDQLITKDNKQIQQSQQTQQNINKQQHNQQCNIKQIAQLMYNNLLYGYLPTDLQLLALLEICKRGWQYMTFLICKILKLLIKIHHHNINSQYKFMENMQNQQNVFMEQSVLYRKLQAIIKQS